jgi:hypothetical protein
MRSHRYPLMQARHVTIRRGSIYIAVLGAAMLVTLIGLTGLAAVRMQRMSASTLADAEQARLYAQSAVELGAQWVRSDPLWRSTRPDGVWVADRPLGDGIFTLEGFDPIDGSISNRPTDPLILRGTAVRGRARQIVEARMEARGTPLDLLRMAIYTTGDMRVRAGTVLEASGAAVGTSDTLRNDGTINGDAECLLYVATGTLNGDLALAVPPRALPPGDVFAMYTALGTVISPGGSINRRVLAPGINPWGMPNAEGVYVINADHDITIRDSRIHGTLVINAPGRTVTITGNVLMHSARSDYPTLLVDGNLTLWYSSDTMLSESDLITNFNPHEAPFEGQSNTTATDEYPSEIRGLIHIRGRLDTPGTPRLRGTALVEAVGSDRVDIRNRFEVIYDPKIYENPPVGYMATIDMSVQPGSWRQVVLP